ncbi:MAG: helix-turn-helix transcriptional regulator [Candidatus Gastranaerophilales bacterium]|nr:helix-turn-helix transcriptional regulator [Candidatus Gastranaerophilales bacterium]
MTSKNSGLTKRIGLKIKMERMKRNLSQEQLAELADLNKNSIGAIERGESRATLETINAIAQAFGMELTELVDTKKVDL